LIIKNAFFENYFMFLTSKIETIHPILKYLRLFLASFILIGCTNSIVELGPEDMGYDFFPLEIGDYREYRVLNIEYSILGDHDTAFYLLKEMVADTFMNQSGEVTYKLNRYTSNPEDINWRLDSIWTATKGTTNLVVIENNIPYVKLNFPVRENYIWDGNAFNTSNSDDYTYKDAYAPIEIEEKVYNSSVKVIHEENLDFIVSTNIRNEIYAEKVGLIYKESIILYYCTENECLGDTVIEQGKKYKQELIDYGKE